MQISLPSGKREDIIFYQMSLIWIQCNSREKGFLTGYQLGLEAWLSGRRLANHRRGHCSSVSLSIQGVETSFLVCNVCSHSAQPGFSSLASSAPGIILSSSKCSASR